MAVNSSNLGRDVDIEIPSAQRPPSEANPKKMTLDIWSSDCQKAKCTPQRECVKAEVFVLLDAGVFPAMSGVLSHLVTMRVTLENKTSGDDGADAGGERGKGAEDVTSLRLQQS